VLTDEPVSSFGNGKAGTPFDGDLTGMPVIAQVTLKHMSRVDDKPFVNPEKARHQRFNTLEWERYADFRPVGAVYVAVVAIASNVKNAGDGNGFGTGELDRFHIRTALRW